MFHFTNLGSFGEYLPRDLDGFVPEEGDASMQFTWNHDDFTKDFDEFGNGWEGYAQEAWEEYLAEAIRKTAIAEQDLNDWRRGV